MDEIIDRLEDLMKTKIVEEIIELNNSIDIIDKKSLRRRMRRIEAKLGLDQQEINMNDTIRILKRLVHAQDSDKDKIELLTMLCLQLTIKCYGMDQDLNDLETFFDWS